MMKNNGVHLSFDLDGTIADTAKTTTDIINQIIISRGGQCITEKELIPIMGLNGLELINFLLKDSAGDPYKDLEEFRDRYAQAENTSDLLYPKVQETLTVLKERGYQFSLCSNKALNLCEKVLQQTNIIDFFPIRVGGDTTHKPNSDHWRNLKSQIGDFETIYYIGDSLIDQQFARIAKINFIFASYGYGYIDTSQNLNYTINQFEDLKELFL